MQNNEVHFLWPTTSFSLNESMIAEYDWGNTGKFVQCLYIRDLKAVIDIERAHIDSDFQFKQDYEIRVRRFIMDLKPTATKDLREMQDTKPLVLWMRLMMRHSEPYRRNKENTYTMILLKNSVEQTYLCTKSWI